MITQAEFAERLAATAADLALAFAGAPNDKVTSSLVTVRANLESKLAVVFAGVEIDIPEFVDRFIRAIVERRAEIERTNPAGSPNLN